MRGAAVLTTLAMLAAPARGEVTLRMAGIAPEGTAWARELRTLAQDLENQTHGEVRMKWYLGAIAGDEQVALERVRHAQLDGLAGASFCERLAPSLAVVRVVSMFENRDEVAYVLGRLKPLLDEEFRKSGFANLADSVFGADLLFSRRPVRSMDDFRATHWWMWTYSGLYQATLRELGVRSIITTPLEQLAQVYASGEVDGFIAPPSAALAFQWSTQARYFTDLDTAMLPGCLVLANSAMDPLPLEQQEQIRAAAARFRMRWNDVTAALESSLVDGLFEKQGLKKVTATPQFRADFRSATKAARAKLSDKLVRRELLKQVEKLLEDYRRELIK
jgi:TRAP-type C4-dicarboxylate transport system substrate-binding protein